MSDLKVVRRALLSVTEKSGLVAFGRVLAELGVELVSTGGTASALRQAGLGVRDVAELTGFPEMLGGRVKTLHPVVHGGILHRRRDPEHVAAVEAHGIGPIDMVVVNLYAFETTAAKAGVGMEELIENIDIGGPSMLRSAAKNFEDVAVVSSAGEYEGLAAEMRAHDGALSGETRWRLARAAFRVTAAYDAAIASTLEARAGAAGETADLSTSLRSGRDDREGVGGEDKEGVAREDKERVGREDREEVGREDKEGVGREDREELGQIDEPASAELPATLRIVAPRTMTLRYGENPHQAAALYTDGTDKGIANATQMQGKELSFNNLVDLEACWALVSEFEQSAVAIIKHTNPCGVGLGRTVAEAYRRALAADPVSAFGGVIGVNREVDGAAAAEMAKLFGEAIVAPGFSAEALGAFSAKKNLRVLQIAPGAVGRVVKSLSGGYLVQNEDHAAVSAESLKIVTARRPTPEETEGLLFAWRVAKHVKSNAIVYARLDGGFGQTVGVGAGQMSRVDAARFGAMKAVLPLPGTVAASDAFFPFADGLEVVAGAGATAVIQPGGSVRDGEVIAAADRLGVAMVLTGVRHFRHG